MKAIAILFLFGSVLAQDEQPQVGQTTRVFHNEVKYDLQLS